MSTQENQKIKDGIKSTFDKVADRYDENKQFIISAKKMVELIELDGDELHILDLSSGTGNIAIELGKKFPNAKIFGVDISDDMLNIARQKTKKEGLQNITYYQYDVEELEFEDMKFDLITCGYGLFFYPDMDKVVYDICGRLKDGGKFVFSTFNENAFQPYSKIFLDMLSEGHGIKPPERIEKRQLVNRYEIEELICQVEYKAAEFYDFDIRFPMSIDEWWKLLNTTGYSGLLSQLEDEYKEFESAYLKHLYSLSDDGTIEFNADSLITVVRV